MGRLNDWFDEILGVKKVEEQKTKTDFADLVNKITDNSIAKIEMLPVLVIRKHHLLKSSRHLNYDKVSYEHIKGGISKMQKASIVMFVDDDGNSSILKNRFGSEGIVGNKKNK